jgi:hypothetical protein
MSVYARSLRCFLKNDSLIFLIDAQHVGLKLEQLKVEGHEPT